MKSGMLSKKSCSRLCVLVSAPPRPLLEFWACKLKRPEFMYCPGNKARYVWVLSSGTASPAITKIYSQPCLGLLIWEKHALNRARLCVVNSPQWPKVQTKMVRALQSRVSRGWWTMERSRRSFKPGEEAKFRKVHWARWRAGPSLIGWQNIKTSATIYYYNLAIRRKSNPQWLTAVQSLRTPKSQAVEEFSKAARWAVKHLQCCT